MTFMEVPMADDFIPRLRGNTFFLFLLRAARDDLGVAPSWGSSSQGLTQTQLFANLMRTVDATYSINNEDTLRQYISKYLKGERTNSKTYYPFKESGFRSGADYRLKNDYENALAEMDTLCRTYLKFDSDPAMHLLVGGLVSLILKDNSIPASASFYTGHKTVTRADLQNEVDFILQPFLLSVWHFIVIHFPEAKEGAETYMRWTADAGGGNPRTITTSWGTKRAETIHVTKDLPGQAVHEGTEETHEEEPDVVVIDEDPHVEVHPYTDPQTGKQVLAQFHVEAKDNGIAIGQVFGGLVIGKRGSKDE
jgi:hypothetical protein